MLVAGVRINLRRFNQTSSVLEALSFRNIDAHHACISEKQACKRDFALTMSLAESLKIFVCIISVVRSVDDEQKGTKNGSLRDTKKNVEVL